MVIDILCKIYFKNIVKQQFIAIQQYNIHLVLNRDLTITRPRALFDEQWWDHLSVCTVFGIAYYRRHWSLTPLA